MDTHVAQHFIDATVEQQVCAIIRKPFRLEEFDDYLSKNEETDNFLAVQAGNEHFVVLTSEYKDPLTDRPFSLSLSILNPFTL